MTQDGDSLQDGDMLHISYPLQDGDPLHNSDPLQDDIIGIIAHVNKVPENKEQDMDLSLFLLFESWFPNFFIVIKSGLLNLLSPSNNIYTYQQQQTKKSRTLDT